MYVQDELQVWSGASAEASDKTGVCVFSETSANVHSNDHTLAQKTRLILKKKKKTCLENPTQTCSSHDLYQIRNTAMFPIIVQVFDHKVRTTDTPPSFSSWLWRKRQLDKGGVANLHWGDKLLFKWVGGWIGIGVGGGRSGGRLRHSSEQWHIWGSTPHPHPQPPPRGPASLPCEHRKRCVNFCLVPLSPSSSKWSTSTTVRGEQGEADWAGSREVGGGEGVNTSHRLPLCSGQGFAIL